MTFEEWFYSEPHRKKYPPDHSAFLAAREAWESQQQSCADLKSQLAAVIAERDAAWNMAIEQCAKSVRTALYVRERKMFESHIEVIWRELSSLKR